MRAIGIALMLAGCDGTLPMRTPAQTVPMVAVASSPGRGSVIVDIEGARGTVKAAVGHADVPVYDHVLSIPFETGTVRVPVWQRVCAATPCSFDLAPGTYDLQIWATESSNRDAVIPSMTDATIRVTDSPTNATVVRTSVAESYGNPVLLAGLGVSAGVGILGGIALGTVAGFMDGESRTTLGWTAASFFGLGVVLLTATVIAFAIDPPKFRPGAAVVYSTPLAPR